jgi:hypothetical protein
MMGKFMQCNINEVDQLNGMILEAQTLLSMAYIHYILSSYW